MAVSRRLMRWGLQRTLVRTRQALSVATARSPVGKASVHVLQRGQLVGRGDASLHEVGAGAHHSTQRLRVSRVWRRAAGGFVPAGSRR